MRISERSRTYPHKRADKALTKRWGLCRFMKDIRKRPGREAGLGIKAAGKCDISCNDAAVIGAIEQAGAERLMVDYFAHGWVIYCEKAAQNCDEIGRQFP